MIDLTEDHNGDVRGVPVCFRDVPDFGVDHRRRKAIKEQLHLDIAGENRTALALRICSFNSQ